MPLKTVRRTQAVGRMLGVGCTLRTHLFLFPNLSSVREMKTQTDKANLKTVVVKSIPGRDREYEVDALNDDDSARPWGFVCSKGNGLQSNSGTRKEERRQQEATVKAWGSDAAPGLALTGRLSTLG